MFVENRLKKLRRNENIEFRYVPTKMHPADLPSRDMKIDEIMSSNLWWHGPDWLLKEEKQWPIKWTASQQMDETELELRDISSNVMATTSKNTSTLLTIDIKKFSSLNRLFRVTAWVYRYIRNVRLNVKIRSQDKNKHSPNCKIVHAPISAIKQASPLSTQELNKVQTHWERHAQISSYGDVFKALENKEKHSLILNLRLQIDEKGLLRCRGRLANADLPYDEKFPKLLPSYHKLTELIIQHTHKQACHSGANHTLSKIREKYWIPNGKVVTKNAIKNCVLCKRHQGLPYAIPPAPPLPKERLTEGHPFSYIGIDHMGPLYVKDRDGKSSYKVWICIFTCAVIRAIHLEIVLSLSTEHFLEALRRFVARRGMPKTIISDNARNFTLARKTLHAAWEATMTDHAVSDFTARQGIEWKFITEYAPWMGGFYERMIGSVKRSLKKSMNQPSLTLTQLQTIATEVEAVTNSRPLMIMETNFDDHQSLTPSHFLIGHQKTAFNEIQIDADQDYKIKQDSSDSLIKGWKRSQHILNQYWSTWRKDYLQSLRERHGNCKNIIHLIPKEGQVVLIGDSLPRGKWKLAKISKLILSEDGNCRTVELLLPNRKVLRRPIKNLYPIEISTTEMPHNTTDTDDISDGKQSSVTRSV